MAERHYSPSTINDLTDIWNYTLETWSEHQADIRYAMSIDHCRAIAQGKLSGRSYDNVVKDLLGMRAGRHLIFYRCAINGNVEVVGVLHESMDLVSGMD